MVQSYIRFPVDRVMTAAIDHAINSEKSKSSELPEQSGDSAIPRDSTA